MGIFGGWVGWWWMGVVWDGDWDGESLQLASLDGPTSEMDLLVFPFSRLLLTLRHQGCLADKK